MTTCINTHIYIYISNIKKERKKKIKNTSGDRNKLVCLRPSCSRSWARTGCPDTCLRRVYNGRTGFRSFRADRSRWGCRCPARRGRRCRRGWGCRGYSGAGSRCTQRQGSRRNLIRNVFSSYSPFHNYLPVFSVHGIKVGNYKMGCSIL